MLFPPGEVRSSCPRYNDNALALHICANNTTNNMINKYQSRAKRRLQTDALGRPMRAPAFALIRTPKGPRVSSFVANQVMSKRKDLVPAFTMNGKRSEPIPFKYTGEVIREVKLWAFAQYARMEQSVMSKANKRHKRACSRIARIKVDKYRSNGTVKEGSSASEHARAVNACVVATPPLALIGLEMIKQNIIV